MLAWCRKRAGRTQDAIRFFSMIPDNVDSYYGGLATNRLAALNDSNAQPRPAEQFPTLPRRLVEGARSLAASGN